MARVQGVDPRLLQYARRLRREHDEVVQHGSAILLVSNDHSGDIRIDRSIITNNIGGSWYSQLPQISAHDDTPMAVTSSTIE
jgi:hypothetical protein